MKPYDKYTLFIASNNVEVHTVDEKLYNTDNLDYLPFGLILDRFRI